MAKIEFCETTHLHISAWGPAIAPGAGEGEAHFPGFEESGPQTGRKEPTGYQEWIETEAGVRCGDSKRKHRRRREPREAGKKENILAADWSTVQRVSVRRENIQDLQASQTAEKGCLRKTHRSQT